MSLQCEDEDRRWRQRRRQPHPQRVVNGVLFLILGDHQCEGVCPRTGQPHLGQVVGAVDADAVNVGRRVRCQSSKRKSSCTDTEVWRSAPDTSSAVRHALPKHHFYTLCQEHRGNSGNHNSI